MRVDQQLKEIRKGLPSLKKVPSRMRINTEDVPDSDQESVQGGFKAKAKKGYQLAEYVKAVDYLNSQSYMKKTLTPDGDAEYVPYELFSQTGHLEEYGLGVYLYLEFIKRLTVAFLVMSALALVPVIYSYINGTGLSGFKSSYTIELARSSLGNISDGSLYGYLVFTVSDLLSMVVLFGFYLHWRSFHQQAVAKQVRDNNILNPSNYALSVVGFDAGTRNLEKKLQEYIEYVSVPQRLRSVNPMFNQTPQSMKKRIFEVEVMYNFNGWFSKFIQYDQLVEEKEKQRQLMKHTGKSNEKFSQLTKELTALEEELAKISLVFEPYEAIIHFETLRAKMDFINFQRRYSLVDTFSYSMKRLLCCLPLPPRSELFMETQPLLIKSTHLSRPEQINWQNLDISLLSRVLRWIFSIIFLIVAIAITSSAIALCTLYVSSKSACTNFDPLTTLNTAQTTGSQTLYCYCAYHFTQILQDADIQAACQQLSNTILYSNLMQVGASLVSSVSNILLITAVSLISRYLLKPSSRPLQYSFTFVGVLLSNYINASILPLIMNGNIFGFQSLTYLNFIKFIEFNNVAVFKDFTIDWYAVVAPYYINFLIIACTSPLINLVVCCLSDWWLRYRVKKACDNTKQDPIIQKQANKLIASTEFDLATEKAIICLNFFIAVMYSSLLPILLPITTVYLLLSFFCKKYIILHYSVRIPVDQTLSEKTIGLIPFVILLHFLMGIWSHTAEGVFNAGSFVIRLDLSFVENSSEVVQRAFVDILMLGGAGLVAAWIIFNYTFLKLFTIVSDCYKDEIEVPKQLASRQNMSYQSLLAKKNILGSYKLTSNPTYGHAIKAYYELKKRNEKQMMRNTLSNMNSPLKDQATSQENTSPQKFGQQTMDTINMRNQEEIHSVNELMPGQSQRYQNVDN